LTTIAIKDGIIAYDSLLTSNGIVSQYDYNKKHIVNGVAFFFTGSLADYMRLVSLYFGDDESIKDVDCRAYVVDGGKLYLVGVDDETGIHKSPLSEDNIAAIGSGAHFALTAMDMGETSRRAVMWAAKRDIYTGGRIRTFKVRK